MKKTYWVTLVVWLVWLFLMQSQNLWHLFLTKWFMSITMVFGSIIAGATSEGGGAVAFPVMTLFFGIKPAVARDFSILIQSVGMMAAACAIYRMRIPVSWRAILWASLGGAPGMVIGMELVAPMLSPAYTKLFFVSVWLSFAGALLWMNRSWHRPVVNDIERFNPRTALVLIGVGLVGGTVSGITGSGIDIVTFSCLVLAFRVSERIATPTSVVLMGCNALFGALWREGLSTGMAAEAWQYWYVCVPVVVVGAPFGAWLIKGRSRQFIVGFLCVSILLQYLAAMLILPITQAMLMFSAISIGLSLFLFWNLARLGEQRIARSRALSSEAVSL